MKTIIAGGRDYHNYDTLLEAIAECNWQITEVVSGGAKGVDALGEAYAVDKNLPLHIYAADWETHGRAAGPIRNRKMAENAVALIALWDGRSKGTKNMIETATKKGLLVYVKRTDLVTLAKVGRWMDEDKGYSIGTREAYEEFVRKRNGG